jgi:hypothetical protein
MKTKATVTVEKLEQLSRISKRGREEHILKRHRMIWEKEHYRLISARRKLEKQMETLMETHSEMKGFVNAVERQLEEDRCEFHQNTVQPVFDLRLDLQDCAKEIRQGKKDVRRRNEEIRAVVKSVKEQQESVLDLLSAEQVALEREIRDLIKCHLDEDFDRTYCWDIEDNDDNNDECMIGIPAEVWEWPCPDESLRCDMTREFQQLDEKYLIRAKELREQYKECLSSPFGGWSREDHLHFCHIINQYPADVAQRRSLLMNRLHREMPYKSKQQLTEHEDWYLSCQYHSQKQQACRLAWLHNRQDLLTKVRHMFKEACLRKTAELELTKAREQQKVVCQDLSEKVSELRRQKLEAVEIEAAIEAQRMEAELKKQQVEWERWIRKRQAQQRKLDDYYSEKERLQAETERQDRERLMKLHLDKTKQALQDKERVEYRQREYTKKVHAKEQVARQAVELAEAKEQDLERIREKVRVIVESDPIRMMKSTEASAAKVSGGSKKELDLQQPLFPLHGYTDQEVC